MCRCNALAMALESLGRSRSAGMVLQGSFGPWVPGSVAYCKNSDWACGKTGAQSGSRLVREGGSPPAAPITCPAPATWFDCWPASEYPRMGRGLRPLRSRPFPCQAGRRPPSYPPPLCFLRGLLRALAAASHPATGLNCSGVRGVASSQVGRGEKGGSRGDGYLWLPN